MKKDKWTNVKFLYGRIYEESELDSTLEEGKSFVIDSQNLSIGNRESKIKNTGYVLQEEGYGLTGTNDLYQYLFVKTLQ
jgi:hypothetical protein